MSGGKLRNSAAAVNRFQSDFNTSPSESLNVENLVVQ